MNSKTTSSLETILSNIEAAHSLSENNDSVRIAAVVSGSEVDKDAWQARLNEVQRHIFNSDGSSLVLSLQEKTGEKTREGNFLGTLLAYSKIKKAAEKKNLLYRDFVTLVGMLFGHGERMSPVTQAKGCRKPAIEVTPANITSDGQKKAFTAIEEALLYFTPVARYLEKRGFKGLLNKWGDETEIASIDLTKDPDEGESFREHDVIKIISVVKITKELAKQKDWVVFNEEGNVKCQLSRNKKNVLISQLKALGVEPSPDGKYYAGISLGPVAVSYEVLDIALDVFKEEIETEGIYFDFDPYFLMALAMGENEYSKWQEEVDTSEGLKSLIKMVPEFFEKVQKIKEIFSEKHKRPLSLKVLDLGSDIYWADVGQHSAMREKFLALKSEGSKGIIARKIAGIPGEKDRHGNIIIESEISPDVVMKNSVVVNSKITGKGKIGESVIIDSELNDLKMNKAFAVRSVRTGSTTLKKNSGLYESLSAESLTLEEGMRHVSLLTGGGKVDMKVSEDTNLRDKDNTYNIPIFGNDISFQDAYNEMLEVSMKELDKRRVEEVEKLIVTKENIKKQEPLKFGTSGIRGLVDDMTDMECYINARGFIEFLRGRDEINSECNVMALGGDLRRSTPRITRAAVKAIEDSGCKVDFCGSVPSPTLTYYAMRKNVPSIMVTGSHVPDDRNGIKFTKKSGEVLKSDEADILKGVSCVREKESNKAPEESLFDEEGAFKSEPLLPSRTEEAARIYVKRYLDAFPQDALVGRKIVLYQHSAVGRDVIKEIFEGLGAEVIAEGRSEDFVPVDTEKISEKTLTSFTKWAKEHKPFAVISTDGDSDRPLLGDENGRILPGDKLGALVSAYLKPDFAAVPISANDAVISVLRDKGVKVIQTKIGSPYVIKAMNDELALDPGAKTVSWESNGGFLTGSDWTINGKIFKALPTRDAVLPILAALLLATEENKTVSELIADTLPDRFTCAAALDNKTDGCEKYTAEMGKVIIKAFSPEDKNIVSVDFSEEGVEICYQEAKSKGQGSGSEVAVELNKIKERISKYFTEKAGFSEIVSINFLDGIRIVFSSGDAFHIRPSGNAPEFRTYATSNTLEKAEEIAGRRFEIIPQIVKDVEGEMPPKSLGAKAAGEGLDDEKQKVIIAAASGKPVYIRPYEEPKVWGIDGIGEYWYGAEGGGKSSVAAIGGDMATMAEVMAYAPDEILGSRVAEKFGHKLPLVKILTPKSRLSVQFHDAKNELWIVTGIDKKIAGENPSIIVGFSKKMVDLHGGEITTHYRKTLEKYAIALNALIDLLEERGYKEILIKTGNVIEAARYATEKEHDVQKAVDWLNDIRGELEVFYNYRKVKVGDVIPIPAGTLHALGAGIEVVEPQIVGPTQSLEDGATYPVRYYFPGYERPESVKKLDIERISEMNAGVTEVATPEVIKETDEYTAERLPGGFEDKGLECHRITMAFGAKLNVSALTSFHNLIVISGEARVVIDGEAYDIPQASPGGEMLLIPASAESYQIIADTKAQIIDTFTPV